MSSLKSNLDALRIERPASLPPARRSGRWLLMVAILAAVAAGAWWWRGNKAPVVKTAVVRQVAGGGGSASAATALNASGYVTPRREATVSSKVTGKVVEVMVEEGMKVEAGQILAKLDGSNIETGLALAEAQLESAKAALAETEPVLALAEAEAKRLQALMTSKVSTASEFDRAQSEFRAQTARQLRLRAELAVADRQVAQWRQQMDDMIIRAPFSGIVTTKNSQPGEMISPMSAGGFTRTGICTMVDMASLEIEVDVSESYINRVQPDQPVEAILDAYPDWRIPGKVIAIIPTADRQKATVKVRIGFEKLDPRILPQMGVKVAFQRAETPAARPEGGSPTTRLVVPKAAVHAVNGRDVAWVLKEGKVERRAIKVGGIAGDDATVTAGLSQGEAVILSAPAGLTEGARVRSDTAP